MFLQTAGSCTELFSYVCKSVRIQRCLKLYHLSLLLVDVSHFPEIPLLLLFFSVFLLVDEYDRRLISGCVFLHLVVVIVFYSSSYRAFLRCFYHCLLGDGKGGS